MVYAANLFSVQFSQGGSVRSYGVFIGIAPRARTRTPPAAPRADRAPGVMALSKLSGGAQLGQHPGQILVLGQLCNRLEPRLAVYSSTELSHAGLSCLFVLHSHV